MSDKRISRLSLQELEQHLGDRDKAVLRSLEQCRYLTSGQIQRLHFTGHKNPAAALRATNRGLRKLQGHKLVTALGRHIGGVRAGSRAYVWVLSELGARMIHLYDFTYHPRKRFFTPTESYLRHTVLVSEAYVQLIELCHKHRLELKRAVHEPDCWRSYTGEDGKPATLKPDLYAVTNDSDYEDHWFLEIDRDTEAPAIVMEKCRRYSHYYQSGKEQQATGVFPLVVWIVPSPKRQQSLQNQIAACHELLVKNLFLVILPNQLETLLSSGAAVPTEKGERNG